MTDLYLVFNHTLTDLQKRSAKTSIGVERVIDLPPPLKDLWSVVPPELPGLLDYLQPLKNWLVERAQFSDYILIQGDFGATYLMVKFAFENGLVPVYSTTVRNAIEEHNADGSVRLLHHFKHIRFRKYEE